MTDSFTQKISHIQQPKGKWYTRRILFSWVWLFLLVASPIIHINGEPFMLFDIFHRKFNLFGIPFFTQDTFLFSLLMLVFVFFVLLFTVIFGRLWCGWACPQTVFLEMIYRRIEFFLEKHIKHPFSFFLLKHISFIAISYFLTHVLLMWIIGYKSTLYMALHPFSSGHVMLIFIITFLLYWVYNSFREKICTIACPYGRLQSILLDSKSIMVVYDHLRGEPRGKDNKGDCIACQQCVSVCPTGIDIKNGMQIECINCTACIDACNRVMQKQQKAPNLIKYDSPYNIEHGKTTIFTTRVWAYTGVLFIFMGLFMYILLTRTAIETVIFRASGTMYQQINDTTISNLYVIKLMNKTNTSKTLDIRVRHLPKTNLQLITPQVTILPYKTFESMAFVRLTKKQAIQLNNTLEFDIYENNRLLDHFTINYLHPF